MQTPKSILLHLDGSARTAERIRLARQLAEAFDAEVTAQPCTLSALMRYPYAIEAAAEAVAIMQEIDKEARDRMHAAFMTHGAGSPRLHWAEPESDGPWAFARRALYADLLVLGQRDRNDPMDGELPGDFLPSVLVDSGRPALVLPYAGPVGPIGRTVLVAWKETRESARAVTAALPWLRKAARVHAVAYGEGAQASLGRLQDYLRMQGVHDLSLHPGGDKEDDVGNRLLSFASDVSADMLVMGCYGHSRAREWVLGGATLSMLQWMTLPVLISH
ncbi:universal stress protein [Variovorax sp. NFACC27]|uniref:universal stress protein n=1 Tax=unclassified Variovorax TaxID=663243 RepID=UPI0008963FA9|nr:universal stress protein [Variovorax sp. YR750]SEF20953.1 Nucleotide-binding universal stress protein, UspA family [Variovorax sp. NFACC28]SEF50952.1 Nucleotide-binding universal stress protein, UspA family [Variovorax sp. NFACC29]SFB68237.1 Nucleotide-binding universal stress protein, UspA family [Variovorax sp. NFACC26]SFG49820.1 Nucleotide-binding universal stress protein, UspA family [Variovorax sp. NFACC27]SEK85290.1 Nucleotide-binding universal stress protein, UspA family [Variovorax 